MERNILVLVELISYSRMIGILKEQWKIYVNIKDEIIKIAADKLSEKLSRTKAVKEAINKSIEEFL